MPSSAHPLASLLGPLRYACARDFANLNQVKDLRTPMRAALQRAGTTLPPQTARTLAEELARIDSPAADERRGSLLRVVEVLRSEGLNVDFVPATPRPAAAVQGPAPAPAPKAEARPGSAPPAQAPVARAPRKARAAKVTAQSEADTPARILSIAPQSGPLAQPLKSLGGRLNPRLLKALERKGVRKVGDVLFLLPRTYEDRRQLKKIAQLRAGERGTFIAEVKVAEEMPGPRQAHVPGGARGRLGQHRGHLLPGGALAEGALPRGQEAGGDRRGPPIVLGVGGAAPGD